MNLTTLLQARAAPLAENQVCTLGAPCLIVHSLPIYCLHKYVDVYLACPCPLLLYGLQVWALLATTTQWLQQSTSANLAAVIISPDTMCTS